MELKGVTKNQCRVESNFPQEFAELLEYGEKIENYYGDPPILDQERFDKEEIAFGPTPIILWFYPVYLPLPFDQSIEHNHPKWLIKLIISVGDIQCQLKT